MAGMALLELPEDPGGFTVDDLESFPDDGRRYELLDGTLFVSPAPRFRHQVAATELLKVLTAACPPEMYVVVAPVDVRSGRRTSLQPDVLVYPRAAVRLDESGQGAPVLAVEVLSPSSRLLDLGLKKLAYARLGIPSYWVVDPEIPAVEAYELSGDGGYKLVAAVSGGQTWGAVRPFPVPVVPDDLLGGFPGDDETALD